MFRIGHGFDVHAFTEGDHIILAGIKIPYQQAFKAHSDGDIALHALCDAMLGACALGDIGQHFPDTDAQYKGIDSQILLQQVWKLIQEKGYIINNVDITIIAQAPKLAPYIKAMNANIAKLLETSLDNINIKATTTEKLGYIGRKEGVAVHAVVLLIKGEQ